ncbi:MAG: AAA family ATPase [Pirellulales bacterium]
MGKLPTREQQLDYDPTRGLAFNPQRLQVHCGPADDNRRRTVIATMYGIEHRGRFDTDDDFRRGKFTGEAQTKFGFDDAPELREALDAEIIAKADAADSRADSDGLFKPQITRLSEVKPQAVESLWKDKLYVGKVTLLCGNPGLGKSFVTTDLAARTSNGKGWPDAPRERHEPGGVVLCNAEDDTADTIVPRLIAHGADLNRIVTLDGLRDTDDEDAAPYAIDLSCHLEYIRTAFHEVENPKLLIVDPISAFMGKVDSHKNAEVRNVLAALATLAHDLRISVLAVSHLRKSGDGEAIHRTMGSLAFVAAARAAFVVCRDPTDTTGRKRLLLPLKNNLAEDTAGLSYSIERYGDSGAPVVAWDSQPVRMTADAALSGSKPGPKPEQRTHAEEWLRERLPNGQQRMASALIDEAKRAGINERLLQRAFKTIGGKRSRKGINGAWLWSLPIDDTTEGTPETCRLVAYAEHSHIDDQLIHRRQDDQLETYEEFEHERQTLNGCNGVPF